MPKTTLAATPENVVLGCLLDKADIAYPSILAEHIVTALREAAMLPPAAADAPRDLGTPPRLSAE